MEDDFKFLTGTSEFRYVDYTSNTKYQCIINLLTNKNYTSHVQNILYDCCLDLSTFISSVYFLGNDDFGAP